MPSARKPRSVSIHWPQSSTMSASFTPLAFAAGVGNGDALGDGTAGALVGDGGAVAGGADSGGGGGTVGCATDTTRRCGWCARGRKRFHPAKAARTTSAVSASATPVREPERRADRLG